ncbi:MAG: RNA polymerase sigma factor [Terriglobales bacterium]
MQDDTSMGGASGRFPATRWSAILAARSDDAGERQRAYATLVAAYWKPVYKYIRLRWGKPNEDAKDLTQEFFARLMEKGFLDNYDPRRARLRTYLRVCADGMVANEARAARRQKRGGEAVMVPLDFEAAEEGIAVTDVTNHLAWARREFRRIALERLRAMTASEEEFRREARALLGVETE